MRALILIAATMLLPDSAGAHGTEKHGLAPSWTFDLWIVLPLLASAFLYAIGSLALWRRVGFGHGIRPVPMCAYAAGWITLAGALVSPLHWLGEHLFTFHMVEHEIIMAVSAPLFVLSRPVAAFLWALPASVRPWAGYLMRCALIQNGWLWLTRPGNATVMHGIVIWAWHAPILFDAAVRHEALHRAQHLSFFVTALLFWWSVIQRAGYGAASWHVFVTMIHTAILGALMALSPRVLYVAQTAHALAWGLTPIEDQQLAGIVMWVPAGTIYAAAVVAFAGLWITRSRKIAFGQP